MASRAFALWVNIAVGLLGIIVGASNIVRAFGEDPKTRSLAIGIACIALAAAWLFRVYMINRKRA